MLVYTFKNNFSNDKRTRREETRMIINFFTPELINNITNSL